MSYGLGKQYCRRFVRGRCHVWHIGIEQLWEGNVSNFCWPRKRKCINPGNACARCVRVARMSCVQAFAGLFIVPAAHLNVTTAFGQGKEQGGCVTTGAYLGGVLFQMLVSQTSRGEFVTVGTQRVVPVRMFDDAGRTDQWHEWYEMALVRKD